jgi:hypothetical protein
LRTNLTSEQQNQLRDLFRVASASLVNPETGVAFDLPIDVAFLNGVIDQISPENIDENAKRIIDLMLREWSRCVLNYYQAMGRIIASKIDLLPPVTQAIVQEERAQREQTVRAD